MNILNFGSLNIDCTFSVEEIVQPGQTIDSTGYARHPGGKGMNQSIAIARAGVRVCHAGMIGKDGEFLRTLLEQAGVDCAYLQTVDAYTGSAFIQVDRRGRNCIVLMGGANRANTRENCDRVLAAFGPGDILLLQNEINEIAYLIEQAHAREMKVVLNPSPMNETVLACDLSKVSLFLMNEDEGCQITGCAEPSEILAEMNRRFPKAEVVLTLGSHGSLYSNGSKTVAQSAFPVEAVDTTGAGDTFTGFLLAGMVREQPIEISLRTASMAAAIAVTGHGAASSIPTLEQVRTALEV
jgi:ribokinase